jgi:hypothetical protein
MENDRLRRKNKLLKEWLEELRREEKVCTFAI